MKTEGEGGVNDRDSVNNNVDNTESPAKSATSSEQLKKFSNQPGALQQKRPKFTGVQSLITENHLFGL